MFVGVCELVCVCVGVCKLFFFVKDFSGTTEPRTLKFGTNVGYNLLYCIRENQPPPAYHSLYLSIIFLSNKNFCHRFLGFYESQSSNFVYTLRVAKYTVGRKSRC